MKNTSERSSNCFDFLRLFAAFAVLVGHTTHYLRVPFLWHHPDDKWWFYDGVPLFFILSGFLVYRSFERSQSDGRPIVQFFANRFLRIAPAIYYYTLIFSSILILSGVFPLSKVLSKDFMLWLASNLLLSPVYHPKIFYPIGIGYFNMSLWTIPTEIGFYLAIPLIYLLIKKIGNIKSLIILVPIAILGLLLFAFLESHLASGMFFKFYRLTFIPFLIFFGLGIFWSKVWKSTPKHIWIASLSFLLYVFLRYDPLNLGMPFDQTIWRLAYALPFSDFVIWFGYFGPPLLNKLVEIGDTSYGIYIWHMPVINLLLIFGAPHLLRNLPESTLVYLVIFLVYSMSLISWRLIEKPALRLKPFTSRQYKSAEQAPPPSLAT